MANSKENQSKDTVKTKKTKTTTKANKEATKKRKTSTNSKKTTRQVRKKINIKGAKIRKRTFHDDEIVIVKENVIGSTISEVEEIKT